MYQAMGLDPPELPESEGPEATAAQLLNHSNSSPTRKTTSNKPQDQQDTHETCQSKRPVAMDSNFEIVVPTVDHESEYEYLPGHFTVLRILKLDSENPQKPSYTVRLLSGERQTMSFDRLMRLKNSSQALDQFNPDSDSSDDLAMIFRNSQRRKLPAFGDDGARSEEEIDPDFHGSTSRRGRRRASKRAEYAQYFRIESDHESKESDTPESSDDELSAPLAPIKGRLRRGEMAGVYHL
ncbi:hypothetical protein N7490_007947 [Penicillium lividum]|nr:hypothetical protein N7490_007947 [Penicillium lividum]